MFGRSKDLGANQPGELSFTGKYGMIQQTKESMRFFSGVIPLNDLIRAAEGFAETLFREDSSGHDLHHTLRVFRMAMVLAEAEHADRELVALAALLHDADDVKLSPETSDGLDHAVGFLREAAVDEERIGKICAIIRQVSFAGEDSTIPDTVEGMCVQDADRLDALGAVGIARAFAYGGAHHRAMHDPEIPPLQHMTKAEYHRHESTTINHFYEKLLKLESLMNTAYAKRIAAERTAFMREYLDEFFREWNCEV